MSTKTCNVCNTRKPAGEFRRVSTTFGGDGLSKACKPCLLAKRRANAAARGEVPAEPEPQLPAGPQLKVEATLGFTVALRDSWVVISQASNEGESAVWLSRREMEQLVLWVDSQPATELEPPVTTDPAP